VLSTATRVARAAREGDLFGVGGELVSQGEREFIDRLDSSSGAARPLSGRPGARFGTAARRPSDRAAKARFRILRCHWPCSTGGIGGPR
jgi:hypothetical protein